MSQAYFEIKAVIGKADKLDFIISATGQKSKTVATNGKLQLLQGRIYFVPVNNKDVDSDKFPFVKIMSDQAEKFDVRYVKNGYAAIVPLQHCANIENDELICYVWGDNV